MHCMHYFIQQRVVQQENNMKMCKFVFTILCVAVLTFTSVKSDQYPPQELVDMLRPIHEYCVKDAEVTDEAVMTYDINNPDHDIMCYMACIMKQSNWMSTTGEIKYDFIINNPWEPIRDIIINAVSQCKDIELIDDECEYIYNFAKCIHRVDTQHWFLP